MSYKPVLAMTRAWKLARQGQTIFGGRVRDYLAEALRQAWREIKANPVVREADRIIAEIRAERAAGYRPPPSQKGFGSYLSVAAPARPSLPLACAMRRCGLR